jgi:hypothetical protein
LSWSFMHNCNTQNISQHFHTPARFKTASRSKIGRSSKDIDIQEVWFVINHPPPPFVGTCAIWGKYFGIWLGAQNVRAILSDCHLKTHKPVTIHPLGWLCQDHWTFPISSWFTIVYQNMAVCPEQILVSKWVINVWNHLVTIRSRLNRDKSIFFRHGWCWILGRRARGHGNLTRCSFLRPFLSWLKRRPSPHYFTDPDWNDPVFLSSSTSGHIISWADS